MKILTVTDVSFPRINGVSTSIATFHREYAERGHRYLMIAPAYGEGASKGGARREGDDVVRIPSRYVPFDPEDRIMKTAPMLGLADELAAGGFDVLHVQTPFVAHRLGVGLAARLGLPTVETYHTFFEEYLFHYFPFLPKAMMRWIARHFSKTQCNAVDGVVVPSTAMAEALRSYGVRTPMHKIPTGLRMEELEGGDGAAFRRRHGIDPGRPTLAHVGRMAFEKNVDFLLEVLVEVRREIPEVLLILAGEGPALGHLRRRVEKLGLGGNVLFVGYLDRATELLDCYRAADAFVFASRTETQGLVLLESMALGVPAVSTAYMGTRDILAPGRGALVAEEELGDFTAKAVRILTDRDLRQRLAAEATAYAAEWSAGAMAERMLELYAELAGRHSAR